MPDGLKDSKEPKPEALDEPLHRLGCFTKAEKKRAKRATKDHWKDVQAILQKLKAVPT